MVNAEIITLNGKLHHFFKYLESYHYIIPNISYPEIIHSCWKLPLIVDLPIKHSDFL